MNKKLLFLLFSILAFTKVNAQKNIKIQGLIKSFDQTPVSKVNVRILNSNFSTSTSDSGTFELTVPISGKQTILISAIGYATVDTTLTLIPGNNLTINTVLNPTGQRLDEVIVTSERKEVNLQKLPLSVTALSAKKIEDLRLWSIKDLTAVSPNLFSSNIGDERPYITIRGVGANSTTMGVAVFVDEIPQPSLQNALSVINDVERIEVLRGPQGTLYGRNAIGGVINIYTKKPKDQAGGYAEASVGNYGLQRYSAAISAPIKKDILSFKLSSFFNERNGYITNQFDGQKFDHYIGYGISAALRYTPSASWDVYLNLNAYMNKNKGAYPYAPDPKTAFSNPYTTNQNLNTWLNQSSTQPSLSISYTGSQFTAKSITSFQRSRFVATGLMDGDFTPYNFTTLSYKKYPDQNYTNNLSQEFRFSNNTNENTKLKWIAGLLMITEKTPAKYIYGIGSDAITFDPNAPYQLFLNSNSNYLTGSIFSQIAYQLAPDLEITAGLRYDREWKKFTNSQIFVKEQFPEMVLVPENSRKADFKAFSPKINLAWQVSNRLKSYVSYSRGFRAGGFNEQTTNPNYINYGAEKTDNYELGIKAVSANNNFRINAAIFLIHWFDMQTLALIPGVGNQQVTLNTGVANNYGAELETSYIPVKGLQLAFNFGYNHARYKKLPLPDGTVMKEYQGNHVFLTPDYTSMLSLQYNFLTTKPTQHLKPFIRAEWQQIGAVYFDLKNMIRQSPYTLLNFKAGLTVSRLSLDAWMKNAFKEKYLAFGYSQNGTFALLGIPQTFGLTTKYNF